MSRKIAPSPPPIPTTHQLPLEAEIGKLREEFARQFDYQERLSNERQRWFDDQEKKIEKLVLHALMKWMAYLLGPFVAVAVLSGAGLWWHVERKADELTKKSEQTAALNDSLRYMLAQSRDSLRLTLDYSKGQLDLQNRLYGEALGAYRDGFLTTLLQNADLKGQVAGQMALANQSIQRADLAAIRLDSTRAGILSVNDSLALRYETLDTVVNRIRTRVDSLGPQLPLRRGWGFP